MSYNSVVNSLGPVAYWRLGETSGVTAYDELSGDDLNLFGTVTLNQDSLVPGDVNKAMAFDGVDGFFEGTDRDVYSINTTGQLAISFLIKADTLAGWQGIIGKGIASNYEWGVAIKDGALFVAFDDPVGYVIRGENATISAATTHHIVINFTGTTTTSEIEIYVDGVKSNSFGYADGPAGAYANSNDKITIGRIYAGFAYRYFDGVLDEVAIFDTALSAANVANLYNAANLGVVAVQGSQTAAIAATKTGTNAASATSVAVQKTQTSSVTASTTDPDDYCIAVQGEQRAVSVANTIGENNFNYFATKGFTTSLGSTPAGEEIPPTLKNPGNFSKSLNIDDFGVVRPSFGEITISNLDGTHDDLLTKKIQGQPATLYYHPDQEIFVLVVENAP